MGGMYLGKLPCACGLGLRVRVCQLRRIEWTRKIRENEMEAAGIL